MTIEFQLNDSEANFNRITAKQIAKTNNADCGRLQYRLDCRGVDRHVIAWTLNPRSRVQLPDSPPLVPRFVNSAA